MELKKGMNDETTSLTLKETGEIAKQYSNGNLSKYIRDLIRNDHYKRMKIQKIQETDKKIVLFQNFMLILLGVTFLILAMSIIINIDILTYVAMVCLFLSGITSFLHAFFNLQRNKKIKGDVKWI